jgi:hypothetical protein
MPFIPFQPHVYIVYICSGRRSKCKSRWPPAVDAAAVVPVPQKWYLPKTRSRRAPCRRARSRWRLAICRSLSCQPTGTVLRHRPPRTPSPAGEFCMTNSNSRAVTMGRQVSLVHGIPLELDSVAHN